MRLEKGVQFHHPVNRDYCLNAGNNALTTLNVRTASASPPDCIGYLVLAEGDFALRYGWLSKSTSSNQETENFTYRFSNGKLLTIDEVKKQNNDLRNHYHLFRMIEERNLSFPSLVKLARTRIKISKKETQILLNDLLLNKVVGYTPAGKIRAGVYNPAFFS
jgi:hypothetical protein